MSAAPDKPQSVIVDNPDPLPVTIAKEVARPSATADNSPARATTTSEQDIESASQRIVKALRSLGQRRINLLWEVVQGIGGLMLISSCCYGVLMEKKMPAEFWLLLGVVVNSYYTRTNHTKIGGVGGTDSR